MRVDYIILGQGIAGTMLAHFLLERKKKIFVVDQFHPNSSSNIAAGVINPITGRRMAKSWMIDEILPFAKHTYKKLEEQLGLHFFYEQEIWKLFSSEEDIRVWNKKMNDPEHASYLGEIVELNEQGVTAPYGAAKILNSCWMDVPRFIHAFRELLRLRKIILEEAFNWNDLSIKEEIQYKNISAEKIIFCEGYKAHLNPYFQFVPFALAKGEYLIISSQELQTEKILNKNIYVIPRGKNLYNIGSTFIWDDLEETVTGEGRNELQEKMQKMITADYTIVEEKAGIRPAMKDRRPVIGVHPQHPGVAIFNGMGTKGVSLSPYLARCFADHLATGSPLPEETNVNRFTI